MEKMKLNIQLFASVQTASYDGRYLKLTVIEESYSIVDNTSTVKWTLDSIGGSSSYYTIYNYGVYVNGSQVYDGTSGLKTKNYSNHSFPVTKGSTSNTVTITHKSDGSADPVSFSLYGKVYKSGTAHFDGSINLTTIPRASSVSANNGTLNQSLTINIDRKDSSFTHTLRYVCGNTSGDIADSGHKVGTSTTWTPPLSLANQNKSGNTVSCTIYCQTYNGSGQAIGSETSTTISLTIPSLSPTATLGTVNDDTSYKSTYGAFIQNKSTIKVSLSGSAQYTDISSYSWEIRQTNNTGTLLKSSSGSYTGSLNISYTPTVSGTIYIKGTVIDKRGASHSTNTTVSVTAYSPPTCSLVVSRVNSTSASYTMSGTGTAISNTGYTANTLEFELVRGSTTVRSTSSGTSYTGTDTIADQSYTYTLTAKDTISGTTDTKTVTISTTFTLMNFSASGKAMAIGKASEAGANEELFEIGMNTTIDGTLDVSGNITGNLIGNATSTSRQLYTDSTGHPLYPLLSRYNTNGTGTPYFTSGLEFYCIDGTTNIAGRTELVLGNNYAVGTNGNKDGIIRMYSTGTGCNYIARNNVGHNDIYWNYLPNKSGTFAMTSDIPTTISGTATINSTNINSGSVSYYQYGKVVVLYIQDIVPKSNLTSRQEICSGLPSSVKWGMFVGFTNRNTRPIYLYLVGSSLYVEGGNVALNTGDRLEAMITYMTN